MATTDTSDDEESVDYEPYVQVTVEEDDTARVTVSLGDDEDHRFEVTRTSDSVSIDYEETLSYRGVTRTREPSADVYDAMMADEDFQAFVGELSTD